MNALVKDMNRYGTAQAERLYADLNPSEIEIEARSFKRYELLPDIANCAWLIENGFVRKVNYSKAGDTITHGLWGKRDIVGLPTTGTYHYELECLTPVVCRLVKLQDVNVPRIRLQQLRQMEVFLNILHCHRIAQRLWMLLDWMVTKSSLSQGERLISLPLTHEAIAELIGSSRVTVTRLLQEFESNGKLVRLSHKKILLN